MGNTLISDSGEIKNTVLANYVQDFLINKATIFGEKNTFKKRACCLKNNIVVASLPSAVDGKVYPTQVNIKVFPTENDITDAACTFPGDSGSYKDTLTRRDQGGKPSSNICKNFYNNYCNKVYDLRKDNEYNIHRSYGSFVDLASENADPNLRAAGVGNPFVDCNCANSIYIKEKLDIVGAGGGSVPDPKIIVQSNDTRCGSNLSQQSYIDADRQVSSISFCVQNQKLGNLSVKDSRDIGLNISQSCNVSGSGGSDSAAAKSPEVTTSPMAPTTAAPTTAAPTTAAPTTAAPTTAAPTTASPTTASPTTAAPRTAGPTTAAPTTAAPTTAAPTTAAPTTAAPITAGPTEASTTSALSEGSNAIQSESPKSNTLLYVGIGSGVLVLLLVLFFVFRSSGTPVEKEESDE